MFLCGGGEKERRERRREGEEGEEERRRGGRKIKQNVQQQQQQNQNRKIYSFRDTLSWLVFMTFGLFNSIPARTINIKYHQLPTFRLQCCVHVP